MQPLQAESAGMLQLAEQPLSCCLLWTNLLGVTLLETPCSPGCVLGTGSVCQAAPRHSHRFSVPTPSPLCAQKLSGGYLHSHSQQEQGRGAVSFEHLEICVKLMFYILMVFVFHYQWSAKALKERDCLPIPAYSSVEYTVTFVLLKGFPGMDSQDAI